MDYVRLKQVEPVMFEEGPCPLPKAWGNISGFDRLPVESLKEFGWYPYKEKAKPVLEDEQKLQQTLTLQGGVVIATFEAVPFSENDKLHALAEARRELLNKLAGLRYDYEVAGTVYKDVLYPTARETRHELLVAALMGVGKRWKGPEGTWRNLSAADVKAIAKQIEEHINNCFIREDELTQAIKQAKTMDDLKAIVLKDGWP